MKTAIILLLISGIIVSGCISNPLKEAPVVKVKINYYENQGNFIADENFTAEQGAVNYLQRPRMTQAKFPAIGGRTSIASGKNLTIGPWEMTPFNGTGTYTFNIGFDEQHYPATNDTVHVSIYLTDINKSTGRGETVGLVNRDIVWK